MDAQAKSKLRRTTIIFWLLLAYIIAAIFWWFIVLEKQNDLAYKERMITLAHVPELQKKSLEYQFTDVYKRNRIKYLGEGIVFLGLILFGAVFVFRSLKKQLVLQQQQQNFMMAVTHELKTPIAVAKLNLETLLKHQLDPQKQSKLLKMTLDETNRLNTITNNILVSSQLEGSAYKISKEEIDLSHLVQKVIEEFRVRYTDHHFTASIMDDMDINGDTLLLQILMNNLLDNAVKYTDKNSTIDIKLFNDGQQHVVLEVIDEGSGIDDNEKKHVFERFYRIGNEATRKKQGTGLGLYLCHKIAIDHNATITIKDNTPKGSIFAVRFLV